MSQKARFLPWFLLILLALIWGSSFILMKKGLEAFTAVQIAALRVTIAGLCLLPFVPVYLKRVKRQDWIPLFVVGFVGNLVPAFLFAQAETVISSAVAGILNSISPLFILLISWMVYGNRFSMSKVFGVIIGFAGAVIMITAGSQGLDFSQNVLYSLLVVLAAFCYAVSANVMKEYLYESHPVQITTFSLGMVGIIGLSWLLIGGGFLPVMEIHPLAWSSFGFIALLGSLGTAFAVILFYRMIQLTDIVFASSVTYLIPIVALAWGLIFGEHLTPMHGVGMMVIFFGVYWVRKKDPVVEKG